MKTAAWVVLFAAPLFVAPLFARARPSRAMAPCDVRVATVNILPNTLYWCPCSCTTEDKLRLAGRNTSQLPRACSDGSVERYRFLCSWFHSNPKILLPNKHVNTRQQRTRGLGQRAVRILHIAPERSLARALGFINNPYIDYVTGDFFVTPSATAKGFVEHTIDIQNIRFPDAHFDMVVVLHVLEHVLNATRAVHEIRRVLRKGGLAILAVPDARSINVTIESFDGMSAVDRLRDFGQVDHFRRFGRDFGPRLTAAGFADVQPTAIGDWYKNRVESRIFRNHEYNKGVRDGFYYNELVFFAYA